MRVLTTSSKRGVQDIIESARNFFSGLFGMNLIEHIPECCAEFQNESGNVTIHILHGVSSNEVVLTSHNLDYSIQDFLQTL